MIVVHFIDIRYVIYKSRAPCAPLDNPNSFSICPLISSITINTLMKLATNGTSQEIRSVRISEETRWVLDNLADMEAVGVILACGHVLGAHEEGALQAAVRGTALIRSGGVGEGLVRY